MGGGALEFYTAGGYATKDMDLALPAAPEVDDAFAALGFDWRYVRERTSGIPEEADALARVEREACRK